jgi:hypothetical protein
MYQMEYTAMPTRMMQAIAMKVPAVQANNPKCTCPPLSSSGYLPSLK